MVSVCFLLGCGLLLADYVTSHDVILEHKIVDLSYTYNNITPNHPIVSKFVLKRKIKGFNKRKIWTEVNDLCSSEHSGTHIDAPVHFTRDGRSTEKIPLDKLYRVPGVKIDVRSKVSNSRRNFGITAQDLEDFIREEGPIPDGAVVLFQTGRGEKAHDFKAYTGIDDADELHFPGLTGEAAEWLVSYKEKNDLDRGILGVGLDGLSLDVGGSKGLPAHLAILNNDLFGLENVANVDLLPPKGFTLTILPMKIGGGSGGPTRILAEIGGTSYSALGRATNSHLSIYLLIIAILTNLSFK